MTLLSAKQNKFKVAFLCLFYHNSDGMKLASHYRYEG